MEDNKILKISDSVSWIGVLDRDIVTFDVVMETKYGTTYNSYFINAEKKTVIETVKEKFWDVYIAKLRQVVDPAEIDYIVADHTEPDHSGCVARLLEVAPKAVVVGTGNAIRYLKELVGHDFPHLVVKDGQTLNLGNKTLQFIGAPNLHWPDSMMTWLKEDKVLFTCDIFGAHFCHEGIFDDVVGNFDDAFRYYFDVIMKPFSKFMLQAIERIRPLDIEVICTGHGAVLRNDWKKYVALSERYAREALAFPVAGRVLVAYVSAYQNTELMAKKIAEGIRLTGNLEVDLCDLEKVTLPELEQKVIEAAGILAGCPTFSQNILLPVYQLFALINPVRDRNKPAASFGSYGWSGEGVKIMDTVMASLKLNVVEEGLAVKFTPHEAVQQQCIEFGRRFGEKMAMEKS